MASAFVSYAHTRARDAALRMNRHGADLGIKRRPFVTERGTRFAIKGLGLLSAGSQYCYAYDYSKLATLVENAHWSNCTSHKQP